MAEHLESETRSTRRRSIHGVLVALDIPTLAEQPWVVDAIDINGSGMGVVLPPEVPEGTDVMLSFKLEDEVEFSRVPATVRHQVSMSGGIRFGAWSDAERLKLLEWLVKEYESDSR